MRSGKDHDDRGNIMLIAGRKQESFFLHSYCILFLLLLIFWAFPETSDAAVLSREDSLKISEGHWHRGRTNTH